MWSWASAAIFARSVMLDGALNYIINIGRFFRFLAKLLLSVVNMMLWRLHVVAQMRVIGVGSLFLVVVSSVFIGLVFTFQMYEILLRFSGLSQLSSVVSFGIFRELSPVVTGLLIAGRVGSSVAAEIAQMKQNEQLDCLAMWGINPFPYLMFPRFFAGLLMVPVLVLVFDAVSIYASWFYAVMLRGMESELFWNPLAHGSVLFNIDVLYGVYKGLFFGGLVVSIALYKGLHVGRGISGLAKASTEAVVIGSLGILAADYVLSQVLY